MRSIAITNQKGGVAKTTTAVNLGACLAERGKSVLLIDLDPQANLTAWLGFGKEANAESIFNVLVGDTNLDEILLDYKIDGLKIAPSVVELVGAERLLSNETGRDTVLKRELEELEGEYDYLLFDCPPS
ncbi:MAG: AAA family ATPase, partial [Candidatus Brocadiales bacterium]